MDVSALKHAIQTGNLSNYYIFSGSEWAVQKIYIDQIGKMTGLTKTYIDNTADILPRLGNKSALVKSNCYIVLDDTEFCQNEKLQESIISRLGSNILILVLSTLDKRSKFYKQHQDDIIVFEPLTDSVLKKYIQRQIDLSDRSCDILIDVCEHDYGRILLEVDKIKRYADYCDTLSNQLADMNGYFQLLLEDGTIYEPPYDAIFDFVGAVLDRKAGRAFDLLHQAYDCGEATLVLLSVLYDNAKAVLQVQSYKGNNLAKATGLSGWQIMNAKKHLGKYAIHELVDMLKYICWCEQSIKSGRIDEKFVMESVLVHVL